ncbi:MAG: cytochrome c family protein [Alphaproteobacteria bacterium]|nr:MAG: cytochrome c family protein [Alphaproteobacteria bacterium]
MKDLELNKIAAAIFFTGVTALAISLTVEGLYGGGHSAHGEQERGYKIDVVEDAGAGGGAAEEAKPIEIAQFFAAASAEKGANLSKACASCHSLDKGGAHKVGPALWGLVNAKVARHADYSYSTAMAGHGGEWTFQSLSEFLEKPKKYISGTKMAYAGMKKPEDRASLLAYLATLNDSPVPLPQPVPQAATAPVEEAPAEPAAPTPAVDAATPTEEPAPAQ